ncbi:MAG: hypothetical protein JNJ45_08355 [Chthonomonas sp.]|nr:hypothetical protein [Chthonomonas sp.]
MATAPTPTILNGSYGEGAGALLRTALLMSAMTRQSVRVHNIRGATRRPGLSSEDLTFTELLAKTCDAELSGAELRSNDLTFAPRRDIHPVHLRASVGDHEKGSVPGNALIILQGLLPALARGGGMSKVILEGETYNPSTLTYDAFEHVTLHLHRQQGVVAFPQLEMAGFGYANYGEVGLEVEPSAFRGIRWDSRGPLVGAGAIIAHSEIQASSIDRGLEALHGHFQSLGIRAEISAQKVNSRSPGVHVTTWVEFERGLGTGQATGQRGVKMETVCQSAISALTNWLDTDATLDPYLADQALLIAALCEEPTTYSTSAVTKRLTTMAWVIKEFLPIHITIMGQEGYGGVVTVKR